MKNLLRFLKDYKKESIIAPLFKLFEASLELIVPLVMAAIIDVGISTGDKTYIFKMSGCLVLLAALGLTASVTAQYFAAKAAVGFATGLRSALFKHIESLSYNELDTIGTSTLITRMTSDINQLQSGVNMVLRLFLRSPFVVFGAMVMAFTVNIKAALVFVVTIPLLSVVVFGVMLLSIPRYKKVQRGLDKILGRTRENLDGARVIRAFNRQADEIENFNSDNESLTSMQLLVGRISALMNPTTFIIINVATLLVIYAGGVEVFNGIITQGEVIALVNYMSQILVELIKLANLIVLINKALACGDRVDSIFKIESTVTDEATVFPEPVAGAPKVEFISVGMRYAKAKEESLSGVNFSAKKGETIGIIGGTGSGKTSLVNLIPRFYDASSGEVKIDGVPVRKYPINDLRNRVGMVMQKAVLFKGTVRENMLWGNPNTTDSEIFEALEKAQAKDVILGKDGQLDYMIEQGGKNLSGGQKQRLTIARALVRQPDILILDDSASALDFATDAKLREALKTLHGQTTVFVVSQRTSSIQFADRIIVLDDGEVAGIGTHEELLCGCEVYKEIYNSQFKQESDKGGAR